MSADDLRGGPAGDAELAENLRIHQVELQQQAEELRASNVRLELSMRRFRQLFEALPQTALVTDRFGAVVDANREAELVFGLRPGGSTRPMLVRLAADTASRDAIRSAFVVADRSGRGTARDVSLDGADGTTRRADVSIERLDESEPGEGDRFIVLLVDGTDRHAEQQQLRLLVAAVAHLNDVVLITDADLLDEPGPRLLFVNEAFERLSGYERHEVLGRSPRFLQGPDTDRAELDRIRTALEQQVAVRAELVNYSRTGRPYWVEIEIVPLFDGNRRCTHFVAVQRDVTERRRLEEQQRQSQRLEALGQLTGGVAHDFNNLLSVILGYADELASSSDLDGEHRRMAQMVRNAAERGADLTQRLLAFGRRQLLQPTVVDVDELIEGLLDGLLRRTIGEHIDLRADLSAGRSAAIDAAQFENVLLNLVVNARDAIDGGGTITISTTVRHLDADDAEVFDVPAGEYVSVSVCDDGRGIASDRIAHVFEPFYTTKAAGKGTGLGLPIVYGFVRQSAGGVELRSRPDAGTTVEIVLPVASARTADSVARSADEPAGSADHEMTVLLVEDDDLLRSLAEAQLHALGHQVVAAATAPEAMSLLDQHPEIGLLFTDVLLPGGVDGKQLADEVRRRRPGLPVLFTSGYTHHALASDGRLEPDVHLLEKPYRRAELETALATVLGTVARSSGS